MLRGEVESLRIEDPGVDKVEFVVTVGSCRELHQVKRSHPNGKWSLAALRADGLLRAIGKQLAGSEVRFVFVSGSDARELAELCEAARDAESTEEFERAFLDAADRKERFESLRREWVCDVPIAVDRLRRIYVRTIGEPELERKVRWAIPALFLADAGTIIEELRSIVEDSVHRTIIRQCLVDELARRGYRLRRLVSPGNAGITLESATGPIPGPSAKQAHPRKAGSDDGRGNPPVETGRSRDRQRCDRPGWVRENGIRRRGCRGPACERNAGVGVSS